MDTVAKVKADFIQLQPERLGHAVSWSAQAQRVFRPQWFAMWGDGFVQEVRVHGENQLMGVCEVSMFGCDIEVATLDELMRLARDEPAKREQIALRIWESNRSTERTPRLLIPSLTPPDAVAVLTAGHLQRVLVLGQSLA